MITKLQQVFGFTRNEVKVVLFLSTTLLAGLWIRWSEVLSPRPDAGQFDYSETDREFLRRASAGPDSGFAVPPEKPTVRENPQTLEPGEINLNTGSKSDLMRLPGIGEEYAERIVLYRQDNGPFRSIEELKNVKGIGKKRLDQIRRFLSLR
ncbi:MAG: helix-hairpin-helix domain-containing protein [Ignavibacteria bacterium]|nr:helix-hairpin-helix domain-containing protein [Ignavibacteria bacterium]